MAEKDQNPVRTQKTVERSVAYPAMNLESAIDSATELMEKMGKGPYSREDAAKGLGYSGISGASARAVAALVHYGLLIRSGNTYAISELGDEILHPTDDSGKQKAIAIVRAARSPKLFDKLLIRFQGQALPGLLENILMRDGVSHKSAKEVASIFKETTQFAGLLKNGVVTIEPLASIEITKTGEDAAEVGQVDESDQLGFAAFSETTPGKSYVFSDLGHGWSLVIKSQTPLGADVKKGLVDITESLEQANNQNQ